jgi:hypothetical protein
MTALPPDDRIDSRLDKLAIAFVHVFSKGNGVPREAAATPPERRASTGKSRLTMADLIA